MKVVAECWIDQHILFPLKVARLRHPKMLKTVAITSAFVTFMIIYYKYLY